MMSDYLKQGLGKDLIPKVDSIFGFQITEKKGAKPSLIYEIDLKNGQGHCKEGKPEKADATFTMTLTILLLPPALTSSTRPAEPSLSGLSWSM